MIDEGGEFGGLTFDFGEDLVFAFGIERVAAIELAEGKLNEAAKGGDRSAELVGSNGEEFVTNADGFLGFGIEAGVVEGDGGVVGEIGGKLCRRGGLIRGGIDIDIDEDQGTDGLIADDEGKTLSGIRDEAGETFIIFDGWLVGKEGALLLPPAGESLRAQFLWVKRNCGEESFEATY